MKKYLWFLLILVLFVPKTTFAVWYLPWTWAIFQSKTVVIEKKSEPLQVISPAESQRDEKDLQIESLKKEIENLKKVEEPPKPVEKPVVKKVAPPPAPKPAPEPVKEVVDPVSLLPKNPAEQCLPIKEQWDRYIVARRSIGTDMASTTDLFIDLVFGTENKPEPETGGWLPYNYARMTIGKDELFSKTSKLRESIYELPQPPLNMELELREFKSEYIKALDAMEKSFNLFFQAFKIMADNNNLSESNIASSGSLKDDAIVEYNKLFASTNKGAEYSNKIYLAVQGRRNDGCMFKLNSNGTIRTTTADEYLFTQQMPLVNGTDGTISVSTYLPIEINNYGQKHTALKIVCNSKYFPVSRVSTTTQVFAYTSDVFLKYPYKCNFVYDNGLNEIQTKTWVYVY